MRIVVFRLFCALVVFTSTTAMERAPQTLAHNLASFSGLPAELKKYLMPFVVSGTLKDMTRGLYNLAALDKKHHAWINCPERMVKILDGLPRICNGISVVKKLGNKPKSLPIMQNKEVASWGIIKQTSQYDLERVYLHKGLELMGAVASKNQIVLAQLLRVKSIDLNSCNGFPGKTALLWAVRFGEVAFVKSLLAAGADPDIPSSGNDESCLCHAVFQGKQEIVTLLIAAGARVDLKNNCGRSFIDAELWWRPEKHKQVTDLLLCAGVNPAFSRKWRMAEESAITIMEEQ